MSLFHTVPIDEEAVRAFVLNKWGLELKSPALKASQNHTYEAVCTKTAQKCIVRVTPDPDKTREDPTSLEVKFLSYLESNRLTVCAAVHPMELFEGCIITVFKYALGDAVTLTAPRLWLTEKPRVVALAAWMATFHKLSKQFCDEHREEVLLKARYWDELHDGTLKTVELHSDDASVAMRRSWSDEDKAKISFDRFGLIHGDVNISNFFWDEEKCWPVMFDWDQAQLGWYLYDMSSPIFTVVTLQKTGNPVEGGAAVPEADTEQYMRWFVEGYEFVAGEGSVDVDGLRRMVEVRRQLYIRFCTRAMAELEEGHGMYAFCKHRAGKDSTQVSF
eukprot:PhM_4_TR9261/c0_g1_i1/m.75838